MERQRWLGWTEWNNLLGPSGLMAAPPEPGCYMLAANIPLSRAVGCDQEGILYIGSTGHILRRLRAFSNSAARPDVAGHIAGWRYSANMMNKYFPLESIWVSWRVMDILKAKDEEAKLLADYVGQHMEMPPLNYSLPRRLIRM